MSINSPPAATPKLSTPPTSFARLSPRVARCVLLALVAFTTLAVGVSLSPLGQGFADKTSRGPGDVALYRASRDVLAGKHKWMEEGVVVSTMKETPIAVDTEDKQVSVT